MPTQKLFQYRLRTILFIMMLSAVVASWIGLPLYDHRVETAAKERLEELGWRIGSELVPITLTTTFRAKFHQEATLVRLRDLSVGSGELSPEAFELILQFQHLRKLHLDGTNLTDAQCRRLGSLRELYVLDCLHTPVRYETLLEMRRKKTTLCHLAHRRAVAELTYMGAAPYVYPKPHHHMRVDYRRVQGHEAAFLAAVKYFGKPLRFVSISNMSIDNSLLDELRQVRSDFKLGLTFGPLPQGRNVLSHSEFQRITKRVEQLSLANLKCAKIFPFETDSSLAELTLNNVGPNVLSTFAAYPVHTLTLRNQNEVTYDSTVLPSSLEHLYLISCKPAKVDLSHCRRLKSIWLKGTWQAEHLLKFLDVPSLRKVEYHYANQDPPAELKSRYQARGVTLRLVPAPGV